ncbi:MAG: hypothetical protein R3330_03550, partial [Saprospiraceae bacterium]|nr:hypothetical protein [Saprospiraceae bacterium]
TVCWTYKEHPGVGYVVFSIARTGVHSTLTLTNTIDQDFPDDIPEFDRQSCIDGWNFFICKRLREYLDPAAPLL